MLYHRTILEPLTAYPIPAGTNYIVLTVQKTAFGLDIIPESLLPNLQKGFHVGDFGKMKKFDQTPYKLPPPTPIHVPAEKRPLEEKSLPKKRSKGHITPVMRRVSRRSELPMAPVQIPQVPQPPIQIPQVPQPPIQIPQLPVKIPQVPQSPVQIPVSHVLEPPVQIPVSQVPQPPMQMLHGSEPPVQILHVSEPVQIPDVPEPVQIPASQVPQPPMQILHVSEPVQIPVSHSHLCKFQCDKSHSHLCRVSQNLCSFSQNLCSFSQSLTLWTLWSRQMHSTSSCRSYLDPKNSSCFTRYPLFLMGMSSPSLMNLKGRLWTSQCPD
ncbi:uncharacterized protein TNCV_2353031 [Trichonephila clavipes]|nr:uncharacterized protein TNCV_2353031 [Trichonephila clavipes]